MFFCSSTCFFVLQDVCLFVCTVYVFLKNTRSCKGFESFDAVSESARPASDECMCFLCTIFNNEYFHVLFIDIPSTNGKKNTPANTENDKSEQ